MERWQNMGNANMNPLSTWTFYRRHKRHAALLLGLSVVVTVGLYSLVALVWAVFVEPPRQAHMALSEFSIVTPQSNEGGPDPAVLAQMQANPDVAKVIPAMLIRIQIPSILPGESFQFELLGLSEEDVSYILERSGATGKRGCGMNSTLCAAVLRIARGFVIFFSHSEGLTPDFSSTIIGLPSV